MSEFEIEGRLRRLSTDDSAEWCSDKTDMNVAFSEVMSEFEIEGRIFSAKAARSQEFRAKLEAAMQLESTGTEC